MTTLFKLLILVLHIRVEELENLKKAANSHIRQNTTITQFKMVRFRISIFLMVMIMTGFPLNNLSGTCRISGE